MWKSSMYFHYVLIIYPWKRALPLIWTSLKILFTQGSPVFSMVKISPMVLEKFLKIVNLLSLCSYYLHKEKTCPSFKTNLISITQKWFVQCLVEIAQQFFNRRRKCENIRWRQDGLNEYGHRTLDKFSITKSHLNFWLRWAKRKIQTR